MRSRCGLGWPAAGLALASGVLALALLVWTAGGARAQSDSTPPDSVTNLALANDSLWLPPPANNLVAHPMVHTIGFTVTRPPAGAGQATVRYRVTGASAWSVGHLAPLTCTGSVVGSLFWLQPATTYDIEVTSRSPDGTALEVDVASATTQPDTWPGIAGRTLYVARSAAPGGDGSSAKPFATIQAGVNAAWPGDQVRVASGVYHEWVSFPNSGTEGAPITVSGEPGATIDGGDARIEGGVLTWTADRAHRGVYSAQLPHDLRYIPGIPSQGIWRDNDAFYEYDTLAGLWSGTGHANVAMAEGWFVDIATEVIYVRSATPPVAHTWRVPGTPYGFYIPGKDWIHVDGFAIRYCSIGAYIQSGSHNVFRNLDLQTSIGVLLDSLGGSEPVDNRIEASHFANAPTTEWGYDAVKGTSMEKAAISIYEATGTIIRDNRIEEYHDGITADQSWETDVYRNYVRHLSDDGLEPDGSGRNFRAWGNVVEDVLSSVSLVPIDVGPTWILYNRLSQFTGRAFKIGDGVSGVGFIYHNTIYCDLGGFGTQQVNFDTDRYLFRNNIFSTSSVAIRWTIPMPGVQMDDDNAWSRSTTVPYHWNNIVYLTLAGICADFGQECHGLQADPRLANPAAGDFSLAAGSPDIDAGAWIPGINDVHAGLAPDRGWLEFGQIPLAW